MKNWFLRVFCVVDLQYAREKGLIFVKNVYGDGINHLNCRSIWKDAKGRKYRISELYEKEKISKKIQGH